MSQSKPMQRAECPHCCTELNEFGACPQRCTPEQIEEATRSKSGGIQLLTAGELLNRPTPMWLVKDCLPDRGLAVLYGAPGAGKTFAALDLAFAISQGVSWFGRRTRQGLVTYVACEGHLKLRVQAYLTHHGLADRQDPHLKFVQQGVDLASAGGDTARLISAIQDRSGSDVALVIIDTLNRAMPGRQENDGKDMGLMIDAAKKIEETVGCVVLYVHHSGKDEKSGSRGHSSLKGACDAELSVRNQAGTRVIRAEKVRDGESGIDIAAAKLKWIDLGPDPDLEAEEGDRIGSCVLEPTDLPDGTTDKLPAQAQLALNYLNRALDNHAKVPPAEVQIGSGRSGKCGLKDGQTACPVGDWKQVCRDSGGLADSDNPDTHSKAFVRSKQKLETSCFIGVYMDWVWLKDKRT